MFCHPASAVGSYSSGPPVARTVKTKSTGGFYHPDWSPCKVNGWLHDNLFQALAQNVEREHDEGENDADAEAQGLDDEALHHAHLGSLEDFLPFLPLLVKFTLSLSLL